MLKVQNISKSYYHKPILKNVSFEVDKGEVIAVLGKNGVGKTTLLKILSGLITPDYGKIIINSIVLNKFDPNSRKDFFYLGHEPGFYSVYTCKENLTLCASLYGMTKIESEIDGINQQLLIIDNEIIRLQSVNPLNGNEIRKFSNVKDILVKEINTLKG